MNDNKDEVVQLFLDDIIPNRFQPREVFDETALKELAVSIKEHGVIQPIIVRNVNGKYEIIAGERRYKASALAGLTKIPAIIRDLDDKESSKVALLENLQRKNLNPVEEARTYQKILELDEMTQEELAKTMGKSQSAVANKIRLLSLPDDIQEALLKEKISERHARALLNVPDAQEQKEFVEKVISTKMSVRALEEEIKAKYPKNNEEKEVKEDTPTENVTASKEGFLNSTPLAPSSGIIQEESSNYGKVVIAPPKEEGSEENSSEKKEEHETGMNGEVIPQEEQKLTIDDIKANAQDIKQESTGVELDDMLKIQSQPTTTDSQGDKPSDEYFSFPESVSLNTENNDEGEGGIIPNIKIGDNSSTEETPTTNIIEPETTTSTNIIEPESTEETPTTNVIEPETTTSTEATTTPEEGAKKIKEVIDELRSKGLKINLDEMNFPNAFQLIVKIDKE